MDDIGEIVESVGPEAVSAHRTNQAIALECLQHLFRSIPFGTTFDLSNGMQGRIERFIEPRDRVMRSDNNSPALDGTERAVSVEPEAGIDIALLRDGEKIGHVEFALSKTGWGMSLCGADGCGIPIDDIISKLVN